MQAGLTIIGRQINTEAGPLDLLAADPMGRLCVIEIKRGHVRRDTISQALDYASCIATMPSEELIAQAEKYKGSRRSFIDPSLRTLLDNYFENDEDRQVQIFIVGTGQDKGLKRMADFLARSGILSISIITYEVFETEDGERLLIRQLTEGDERPELKSEVVTVEDVVARADREGVGNIFRQVHSAAKTYPIYPRPSKLAIMYTPTNNRTRCLYNIWSYHTPANGIKAYVAAEAFVQSA